MARSSECKEQYAQKVLDSADIVNAKLRADPWQNRIHIDKSFP
jgi:hypothetical protein